MNTTWCWAGCPAAAKARCGIICKASASLEESGTKKTIGSTNANIQPSGISRPVRLEARKAYRPIELHLGRRRRWLFAARFSARQCSALRGTDTRPRQLELLPEPESAGGE